MASQALTSDVVAKMKVADLKTELASRNLSTKGLKKELTDRLLESLASSDATAQSSGDAPAIAEAAMQATDNLPSELPAVPPAVTVEAAADIAGTEPPLEESAAGTTVDTSAEPSAVVRPSVNSIDQTPGVISSTPNAVHTDIPADTPLSLDDRKRKREDQADPQTKPAMDSQSLAEPVKPVAVQMESAQPPNDGIPARLDDPEGGEAKRQKVAHSHSNDLPTAVALLNGSAKEDNPQVEHAPNTITGESSGNAAETTTFDDGENLSVPLSSQAETSSSFSKGLDDTGTRDRRDIEQSSLDAASLTRGIPQDSPSQDLDTSASSQSLQGKIPSDSPPESKTVCISHLVRPFTLPALREKLEEYGAFEYFWINSVKSHCYLTYEDIQCARSAKKALQGAVWPEGVGRELDVTYLPESTARSLVQKEETSGRARLELVTSYDSSAGEWAYRLEAPVIPRPSTMTTSVSRLAAVSLPSAQMRSGSHAPPPSQSGRNGFAVAPAQDRPRQDGFRDPSAWMPPRGTSGYKTTTSQPSLYYRPVDIVAAGRRLRDMERQRRR